MGETRVQARVVGRRLAASLIELAGLDELPPNAQEGFWDELRRVMPSQPNGALSTPTPAMSDEEAKAFEKTKIPFGQHQFTNYGQVPINYLSWVADQGIQLRRYMRSARAQKREE